MLIFWRLIAEDIRARQLIQVHISAIAYMHAYVCTWCHVCLGMSLVTLNFLGVTFGDIVCHGNFHRYD